MKMHLFKFIGVPALVLATAFAPLSLTQTALAASSSVTATTAAASTNDPITYIVQPGDNLSRIAQAYGTSVNAILALNPQITNPSLIYPGEVLQIPVGTVTTPVIPITGASAEIVPSTGPQGSYVQVIVTGFPANTPIQIGLHKLNRDLIESTTNATTDASGSASVTVRIPTGSNVNNNRVWLAKVSTTKGHSVSVTSNEFVVSTSSTLVSGTTITYVVQPGNTLSTIAQAYGTSVNAILALNPQLAATVVIYPGEVLVIPVGTVTTPVIPITGPSAQIVPSSGPQGSYVQVIITGFPANTSVQISLHKLNHSLIESTTDATTNASGNATVTVRIPTGSNVNNNLIWVAQVSTTSGTSLSVTSNEFVVSTTSPVVVNGTVTYVVQSGDRLALIAQEYGTSVNAILALNPQITDPNLIYPGEVLQIPVGTVTTSVIPMTGPSAQIVPSSGPQGAYVQVIITGFPANTPIHIGLHKPGQKLIESSTDATTNAYGAASVTARIPKGSNINNNREWLAKVSTTSGTSVTVESTPFYTVGN
jgi:LysM repeat protein